MRLLPLPALVVLATVTIALAAPAPKGPWDGFGAGSWVHSKSTTHVTMTGMSVPPQTGEKRHTLVSVSDKEWVVRVESKVPTGWGRGIEMRLPRVSAATAGAFSSLAKTEDLGTESVEVEGTSHSCKKTKSTMALGVTTAWTSEEHGVLKSESQMTGGGTSLMTVTSLSKPAKVGDQELVCRQSKTVTKAMGSEVAIVTLASDAVPGHTVRSETSAATGSAKTSSVMEVVAFEAK